MTVWPFGHLSGFLEISPAPPFSTVATHGLTVDENRCFRCYSRSPISIPILPRSLPTSAHKRHMEQRMTPHSHTPRKYFVFHFPRPRNRERRGCSVRYLCCFLCLPHFLAASQCASTTPPARAYSQSSAAAWDTMSAPTSVASNLSMNSSPEVKNNLLMLQKRVLEARLQLLQLALQVCNKSHRHPCLFPSYLSTPFSPSDFFFVIFLPESNSHNSPLAIYAQEKEDGCHQCGQEGVEICRVARSPQPFL